MFVHMFDRTEVRRLRRKLSAVLDRHLFVNVRPDISQEVPFMSTMAAAPGYGFSSSHRSAAPRTPSVRLTRRGRLVLLALFLGMSFVLATMLGDHSVATGEAGRPVETRTVVVGEGDTLWAIAADVAEPGEVREMIHYIQELNALPGVSLQRGQKLAVPVG
jgi:hypothetical protein